MNIQVPWRCMLRGRRIYAYTAIYVVAFVLLFYTYESDSVSQRRHVHANVHDGYGQLHRKSVQTPLRNPFHRNTLGPTGWSSKRDHSEGRSSVHDSGKNYLQLETKRPHPVTKVHGVLNTGTNGGHAKGHQGLERDKIAQNGPKDQPHNPPDERERPIATGRVLESPGETQGGAVPDRPLQGAADGGALIESRPRPEPLIRDSAPQTRHQISSGPKANHHQAAGGLNEVNLPAGRQTEAQLDDGGKVQWALNRRLRKIHDSLNLEMNLANPLSHHQRFPEETELELVKSQRHQSSLLHAPFLKHSQFDGENAGRVVPPAAQDSAAVRVVAQQPDVRVETRPRQGSVLDAGGAVLNDVVHGVNDGGSENTIHGQNSVFVGAQRGFAQTHKVQDPFRNISDLRSPNSKNDMQNRVERPNMHNLDPAVNLANHRHGDLTHNRGRYPDKPVSAVEKFQMQSKHLDEIVNAILFRNSSETHRKEDTRDRKVDVRPTRRTRNKCHVRKNNLVYIKTHKTASSTTCNVIYRYALKRNISMLLFTMFPYPLVNLSRYLLHNDPLAGVEHPRSKKFMIAADHMRYEREELDKVMVGSPAYITTLRYPPDHLRSLFHYFKLGDFFGFGSDILKPVQYYMMYKDNFMSPNPKGPWRLENRNANMFGLPEEAMNDTRAIEKFLHKMDSEFSLVMITEHFVESMVLLRRTMCWDLGDIIFSSINIRQYERKGEPFHPTLIQMHRKWNLADYMMYEYFNATLWRRIEREGDDFQQELRTLLRYQSAVNVYCSKVFRSLRLKPDIIFYLYNLSSPLVLPASRWGPAIVIDFLSCALMRVDIMPFANLMRVKQYPDLCKHLSSNLDDATYLTFAIDQAERKVVMMRKYCAENPERTLVPLRSLTIPTMYMWV